jgi:hypothetical protein
MAISSFPFRVCSASDKDSISVACAIDLDKRNPIGSAADAIFKIDPGLVLQKCDSRVQLTAPEKFNCCIGFLYQQKQQVRE